MPACLVIADDLTGANATGVQLSNLGFKSCTILDPDRINEKSLSSYDCILSLQIVVLSIKMKPIKEY